MAQGHKTGGRQAGTPNKITAAFKDAVRLTYDRIGGHEAFAEWATENRGEFYKIAARLIPSEMAEKEGTVINVIVDPYGALSKTGAPTLPAQLIDYSHLNNTSLSGQRPNAPAGISLL